MAWNKCIFINVLVLTLGILFANTTPTNIVNAKVVLSESGQRQFIRRFLENEVLKPTHRGNQSEVKSSGILRTREVFKDRTTTKEIKRIRIGGKRTITDKIPLHSNEKRNITQKLHHHQDHEPDTLRKPSYRERYRGNSSKSNMFILRAKQHQKSTTPVPLPQDKNLIKEPVAPQNKTTLGVPPAPKNPLRSGLDDESFFATRRRVKLRQEYDETHSYPKHPRITKMPEAYQLQEDEQKKSDKMEKLTNEKLNPFAIDQQMQKFVDLYKDEINITMEVLEHTTEYKKIILLKMADLNNKHDKYFRTRDKYTDEPPEKKIIFIVQGLSVLGMAQLINNEVTFRQLMSYYIRHLDKFDVFVLPVANPDGLAFLNYAAEFRYWNKNMSPHGRCSGVALDRNFDIEWNASHRISSCSQLYPGPAPFSEPETRAIRDIFHFYSHKIIAYIHVHASTHHHLFFKGDAILYPRGFTDLPTDDDKYIDLKGEVEDALKNASFKVVSVAVEPLYNWYGKVTGTSVDYASTVYGIPYAMEFSMQIYEKLEKEAMTNIWSRVIDAVFTTIAKNLNSNDVNKKK